VAHGHVNRIILLEVTGRPLDDFWEIEQPNGVVTVVDVNGTAEKLRASR
jgi:broad specificity phosphatase PhoE